MSRQLGARWDSITPRRWSWLWLFAAPASYLLVVSLIVTMAAKLPVVRGLDDIGSWPGRWLATCLVDVAFFLGVTAVFSLVERRWDRMRFATIPLALVIAVLAIVNAGYLSNSGNQLSWPVLELGIARFGDVQRIVSGTDLFGWRTVALAAVLVVAGPASVIALRRLAPGVDRTERARERVRASAAPAILTALLALVLPTPSDHALARLHGNGVVRTAWGVVTGGELGAGTFMGYAPPELVTAEAIAMLRAGSRPNIVVIVLESVRRDRTSLAAPDAPAQTPNLVALASRGTEVTAARAVVPHTTKSLWTMFCGRLPLMQNEIFEVGDSLEIECLPRILTAAGYRTAFLQSAIGNFEERPRLVANLGYRHFVAGDHLTKEVLGYLAADDLLLVDPLERWIDQARDQPFFATLLTSSTHHPYTLSPEATAHARANNRPMQSERDMYDRMIEASDRMIGSVVEALRRRGLLERTIIVVLGDHGEGFGDKGVRQHDTNFYDEALRVPFVMAGPGIPQRRIDLAASLFDLAPTLLDVLGVAPSPAATATTPARSVLRIERGRVLPFACFFDNTCEGFVLDDIKVVALPGKDSFAFDLARDPGEHVAVPLTQPQAATLVEVQRLLDAHRTERLIYHRGLLDAFPDWSCVADRPCAAVAPLRSQR